MHIAGALFCSGHLISATNLKTAVWSSQRRSSLVQRSRSSFRTTCMFQLDLSQCENEWNTVQSCSSAFLSDVFDGQIFNRYFSHHMPVLVSVPTWLMTTKTSWKAKTCWWPTMMWTMRRTPRAPTTGGTGRTWSRFYRWFLGASEMLIYIEVHFISSIIIHISMVTKNLEMFK